MIPVMTYERARELLAVHRRRVEDALARLAPKEDSELSHLDQHPADDDLQDDEVEEGLTEQLEDQLEAIERAERRLEKGTYGLSVESGGPIPDARLEAVPWAERTEPEQERYDHG